MPTYEYRCTSCGDQFETFQRIDEESLRDCKRCGGELRKVFHAAGIVFKGSGFYATDSRSKSASGSPKKETKTESTKDSSSGDSGTTSSEPKKPAESGS